MEVNIVTNQRRSDTQLKPLNFISTPEANDQKTVGNFLEELEMTSLTNWSHKSNLEWNITLDSPTTYFTIHLFHFTIHPLFIVEGFKKVQDKKSLPQTMTLFQY